MQQEWGWGGGKGYKLRMTAGFTTAYRLSVLYQCRVLVAFFESQDETNL